MKAPSWLSYYLESFRPHRFLRESDRTRSALLRLGRPSFIKVGWREPCE